MVVIWKKKTHVDSVRPHGYVVVVPGRVVQMIERALFLRSAVVSMVGDNQWCLRVLKKKKSY
jgi:hypothetical protein